MSQISDSFELVTQVISAETRTLVSEVWQCCECGTTLLWNKGALDVFFYRHRVYRQLAHLCLGFADWTFCHEDCCHSKDSSAPLGK